MKRRDEVLVGVFTTVALIVIVLGAIWLARGGLSKGYPLYSRFAWGAGLKQGQPVWLVGVTVGFVDKVDLDPKGTLVVTYRIQGDYKVPRGTVATVVPNGLFGDQAIALTPEAPNAQVYSPGDTVPVGPPVAGVQAITARADTITRGVNVILNDFQRQLVDSGGIAEIRRTLEASTRLVAELTRIAALQSREFQATMATVRSRVQAIDSMQIDSTVRSLRVASGNLATMTSELNRTTGRLNSMLQSVDSGNGTIGKLLNDPGLYDDLRKVLVRFDSLSADLKANPRRYFNLTIF